MIPAGFLAVFCLLFFLSGRVWNVEIRGNILNPTPQLMSFLKEQGVCFGVSRKKISCSALAASLRREFPEITWVSAGFSGTGLRFEIREGTAGEKTEPERGKKGQKAGSQERTQTAEIQEKSREKGSEI